MTSVMEEPGSLIADKTLPKMLARAQTVDNR